MRIINKVSVCYMIVISLLCVVKECKAYDYWEKEHQIEDETIKASLKLAENISLKMLWGEEINRNEFNNIEKKSFKEINGALLNDILDKKLEIRDVPRASDIYNIMKNKILKNQQMFADGKIDRQEFITKYICVSGVQEKQGKTTYMDETCYQKKYQAYIDCGVRGYDSCVRAIAMQGQHYYDECEKERDVTYEICDKGVGLGYIDNQLIAVIPYDNFEWEQSLKDIPIEAIVKKMAQNYGKPDKIIKRNFTKIKDDCEKADYILRQNNIKFPISCEENTESYFWIDKPWVQTIEITFDNQNTPKQITRSLISWGAYNSIVEAQEKAKQQSIENAKKRQEEEDRRLEEEKNKKINDFNI